MHLTSDEENLLEWRLDAGSVNFESVSLRRTSKREYIKRKNNTVTAFVVCFRQKYTMFVFVTFDVDNAISCSHPDRRIFNVRVKWLSDLVGFQTHKKPNVFFQCLTRISRYVSTVTYFMRFLHSSRFSFRHSVSRRTEFTEFLQSQIRNKILVILC